MIQLANITLSYDGVRIVGVLTIPADAHHAGLAPLRYRQSRFVPREGLDGESAGDLLALCVAFGRRLQTEGVSAWEGTDPLF